MRPTSLLMKSGRSAWKGPYFVPFPNLREAIANHVTIETQARSCTILPNFVGVRFNVHNGRDYVPVMVTQDMVGHKLGEFSHTKKRFTYKCVPRFRFCVLCFMCFVVRDRVSWTGLRRLCAPRVVASLFYDTPFVSFL